MIGGQIAHVSDFPRLAGTNLVCSQSHNGNGFSVKRRELDLITLASFVNNLRGNNAIYVDTARNLSLPTALGTVFKPFNTVTEGVVYVPNGGVVSIVEGSYPASAGNIFTAGTGNKAMTLEAPVGIVTIGN